MAIRCWLMRLLLLCVWCSMDTFTVITADAQNLTITKALPTGDPVEGDTVQLICDATNLQSWYFIEWTRLDMSSQVTLASNGISVNLNFTLITTPSNLPQSRTEPLIINDVQKEDASTYRCIIKDSNRMNVAVITGSIDLTVRYFPSAMYPICFPDGPFTVEEGTTVNMSCTTEIGNPPVQMEILTSGTSNERTSSSSGNEQMMSLNLSVNAANQGDSYTCKITSATFPGMESLCTMGPISFTSMTSESSAQGTATIESTSTTTEKTSNVPTPTETTSVTINSNPTTEQSADPSARQPDSSNTDLPIAIIAGAAGGGGFLLLILITLIVLYLCRCCCFDEKSHRSSLWLTDVPLAETVQDTNTDHDIDRSEPKVSTTAYQNVTDLMTENKPDPRLPPQFEPETSHLNTQEMTNGDDEAADFNSHRQFSIHSQNNDQNSSISPGISSFKLSRSNDRTADKKEEEHLGTVEPEEGDDPTYGVVQKSNRVSHGSKKEQPEITSDGPDPWANASSNQQENKTPASTDNEYAEMPSLPDDPPHSQKPTAMIKPVSHTPKPLIATKPVKDHQSSRRTNTNQAPPSVAKKPIKKFKAKERNPSADHETPLPPPVAPSVSPHPPPPPPPLTDGEENASVEGYGEEGGDEVPSDTQVPHEAHAADDHDVTYADLDLQSATSDAMTQPQEEQTLYASIVSK